jgi:SnoaL-like domain
VEAVSRSREFRRVNMPPPRSSRSAPPQTDRRGRRRPALPSVSRASRGACEPHWLAVEYWRAMSRENVELSRALIEAFNAHDVEAMVRFVHPEIEWLPAIEAEVAGEAEVYRGPDAVREYFTRVIPEYWEDYRFDITQSRDLGDQVLLGRPLPGARYQQRSRDQLRGRSCPPLARRKVRASPHLYERTRGPRSRGTAGVARAAS